MRINLITNLTGYPHGTATAKRIKLICKSIQTSGHQCRVYTNNLRVNMYNTKIEGKHEDIFFQYLHKKKINKKLSKPHKIFYFISGCMRLFRLFCTFNKTTDIVYSYNHGNYFSIYILFLCKLFKIRLLQEINEWYHNDLNLKLEKLAIEGPLIKYSDAAIVISSEIEKKVLNINPKIKVLKIPVLEDFSNNSFKLINSTINDKYCFWMGLVDSYIDDIIFMTKACAKVFKSGLPIKLYISGPYSKESSDQIEEIAIQYGYPLKNIKLLGYVSEEELELYCKKAYLFIIPLWNNERSKARFPTKIASFMQAGKPVISCKIGEIGTLLTDSVNIVYYKVGDLNDLTRKIHKLLVDTELYSSIAENSYNYALNNFNYLAHVRRVNILFNSL